jgi:hypothetical protein
MAVAFLQSSRPIDPKPFLRALGLFLSLQALTGGDVQAQCSLVCNNSLQVSLNASGTALITTSMVAPSAGSSCPGGTLTLELTDNYGNTLANPLDCSNIGTMVTATVQHSSGNSCSSSINLQDVLAPMVSCPDKFIWCNQDTDPEMAGLPTFADNCTDANALILNWIDQETTLGCGVTQNGLPVLKRIDRNWTVEDEAGNSASCTQRVWLKHITLQNVTFPPSHDGFILPALDCSQNPDDLSITGEPTVDGIPIGIFSACELNVAYTDQRVNYCPPAGYSILRTWTAVDFCSSTVSNRVQVIKIQDVTPPVVTAPANFSVGTAGILCTTSVTLPQGTATDNCSAVTVTPNWEFGSGFGPFSNVPVGEHVVNYVGTDACGNAATKTMLVTVTDNTPPQAICKSALQVSLSSVGVAYLMPASLDAGSFDNCGSVTLTISKDELYFHDNVQFSCDDQGPPITVQLKVKDEGGLENICEVDVFVRDFLKPELQCPPNITISCLQDYTDLSLTGQAIANDNCAVASLDFIEHPSIGSCNVGSDVRNWRAIDASGNFKSCSQVITINPISTVAVEFPLNATVNNCANPQALQPPATGEPVISGLFCSPLSVTFTDQITSAPLPYCRRIKRDWKVIDWCIYTGNPGSAGIWEKTQLIDIVDHVAPDLAVPAVITLSAVQTDCKAPVNFSDATASDCAGNVTLTNNSIFATSNGSNASGNYPVGTYQIVFTATDGCGNSTQKTTQLVVKDGVAPTAVCKNNVNLQLQTGGSITLNPAWFDGGSSDACSLGALEKSIIPTSFSCQTKGNQQVILTIQDAAGNHASCITTVLVQDSAQYCSTGGDYYNIGGGVRTETGDTVRGIPVALLSGAVSQHTDCDSTGMFQFVDVASDSTYRLIPYNNANWFNGLSTFDLLLISKHILGIQPLGSPYKMIAADANKSGSVTTFDIVQFRKLILGIYDTIPGVTSWRFIPANFNFEIPNNPFSSPFPEEIVLDSLHQNLSDLDFIGIKVGDMNNSTDGSTARSLPDTLYLKLPDVHFLNTETQQVPVRFSPDQLLEGFQFEMHFDTQRVVLEGLVISDSSLLKPENAAVHGRASLSVSWNPAFSAMPTDDSVPLFFLKIRAKKLGFLSQNISLASVRMRPEVYTENNISALALQFSGINAGRVEEALQNVVIQPNPFSTETAFRFELARPDEVALVIRDVLGNVVFEKRQACPAGEQIWRIEADDFKHAGVYSYSIGLPNGTIKVGKLVLLNK